MPVHYIGRSTYYNGKKLMDILCRLKGFGVGRMVYRNHFKEHYPEPSYFIITNVDANMADPCGKCSDKSTNTKVKAQKIFRGMDIGEVTLHSHWKPDWRLVPKNEEHLFTDAEFTPLPKAEVLDTLAFPPLYEKLLIQNMKRKNLEYTSRPMLRRTIKSNPTNRAVLVSSKNEMVE